MILSCCWEPRTRRPRVRARGAREDSKTVQCTNSAFGAPEEHPRMTSHFCAIYTYRARIMEFIIGLPSDALLHILAFLPLADLARVRSTSSVMRATCNSAALWHLLLRRDFDEPIDSVEEHAASSYQARSMRHRARITARSRLRDRLNAVNLLVRSQVALGYLLSAIGIGVAVLLPLFLLLAFLVSVAVSLDTSSASTTSLSSSTSWGIAFLPGWLFVSLFTGWILFLGCLAWSDSSIPESSVWHGQLARLSWLPCHGAVTFALPRRPIAAALACVMMLLLALQVALVCFKISSSSNEFKWVYVALPLWATTGIMAAGSIGIGRLSRDSWPVIAGIWGIVGPVIITLAVLVASLDTGVDGFGIPLQLVLIPLWTIAGWVHVSRA